MPLFTVELSCFPTYVEKMNDVICTLNKDELTQFYRQYSSIFKDVKKTHA